MFCSGGCPKFRSDHTLSNELQSERKSNATIILHKEQFVKKNMGDILHDLVKGLIGSKDSICAGLKI